MDDSDLTPAERAEIERVNDVLADPAVWAEPPPYLQEAVVAAIAEEAGAGSAAASASPSWASPRPCSSPSA